jgi:hypothetical protein
MKPPDPQRRAVWWRMVADGDYDVHTLQAGQIKPPPEFRAGQDIQATGEMHADHRGHRVIDQLPRDGSGRLVRGNRSLDHRIDLQNYRVSVYF